MANISGNNSNIRANEPTIVDLGGELGKAEVTKEGKIRLLENGRTFSVKFNPGGETTSKKLTTDQQIHLAKKVLEILKDSGGKFESLDKLTIQSNKITHFDAKGIKQELMGEKTNNWVSTAQSTMKFISNLLMKSSNDKAEKKNDVEHKSPEISLRRVTSNLLPLSHQLEPPEGQIHIRRESAPSVQKDIKQEKNQENPMNITFEEEPSKEVQTTPVQNQKSETVKTEPQEVSSSRVSSSTTEKIPKKLEVTNEQKEKRVEVTNVISGNNAPPKVLAEKVVNLLGQGDKIKQFKELHEQKIGKLQQGWVAAKKEMGSKMDDPNIDPDKKNMSFAQFRDEANKFIHSLVNEAAEQMGIGVTTTKIFGTPGYNSDKDITFNSADPKKPLTTEEMVLLKSIADMLTTHLMSPKDGMGVLPGTALDTEWYIELKFMGKEVQGFSEKSALATLDMAMGIVQAKEGLKNDPDGWKEFKERDLEQTKVEAEGIPSPRLVKLELYNGVEKFYASLEEDIHRELIFQHSMEKGGDPEEIRQQINELNSQQLEGEVKHIKEQDRNNFEKKLYNAKVLAQYPKLMELGKRCGELENEIAELKQQKPVKQEKLDKLIVEHDILYALINSRQPEGTMGSSELATTLFSSLGQQVARGKEMAGQALGQILSKQKGQKTQNLLEGLQKLNKIEEKRAKGSSYDISQLILAGQERLGQFVHVVSQNNYESKSAINAGKYCLRVAESNYFSLREVAEKYKNENKPLPDNFNKLFEEAKNKYNQAKYLEQCKRGFNLNAMATANLLASKLPENTSVNIQKKILDKINTFEEEYSNISMAKTEKLAILCNFLSSKECGNSLNSENATKVKFGNSEFLLPTDPELRNILQAFAGYDKKEFQEMHQMTVLKQSLGKLTEETKINKEAVPNLTKPFKEIINSKKSTLEERKKAVEGELKKLSPPMNSRELTRSVNSERNTEIINLTKDLREVKKELDSYVKLGEELNKVEEGLKDNIAMLEKLNRLSEDEKTPEETSLGKSMDSLKNIAEQLEKNTVYVGDVQDVNQHMESIKQIHGQGEIVVKNAYNLTNPIDVEKFARGVEEFSRQVQNFMFENELMPPLINQVPIFSKWGTK